MSNFHWNFSTPEQIFSLIGSLLVLFAYGLTVARPEKRRWYFSISLAGGVVLLVVALIYHNAGLVFLEISWIGINIWGLGKAAYG